MLRNRFLYPFLLGLAVVLPAFPWLRCLRSKPTTVFLVRHADRVVDQDALSPAGQLRARELIHVLQKADVKAIYRTEAARTAQTAAPLAAALGITAVQIPAANTAELVSDIRTHQQGKTVLVVGHSNTVPAIIAAFGGPVLPNIPESEFDNLFGLSICRCRREARLIVLQYGAPSP